MHSTLPRPDPSARQDAARPAAPTHAPRRVVAAAVADYLRAVLDMTPIWGRLLQVLLSVGTGALVYGGLSYAMKSQELTIMMTTVRRRLRKA